MHIETININFAHGGDALSRAFIAALMRGPVDDEREENSTEFTAKAASTPPKIGEVWSGQGGIYCGLARCEGEQPDYHLILAETAPEQGFKWADGLEYASTIVADGHKDFSVPTRFDSALLYANVRDKLDTSKWHWTSTQSSEDCAFDQLFSHGNQYHDGKGYEGRCRFVRRSFL